jgi:hypothetical protein
MCGSTDCPKRKDCYRNPESGTVPHPTRQSWALFNWRGCDSFIPVTKEKSRAKN